jgi:GNAT superfamily N-acetyltransferase
MLTIRDARREDLQAIVALLAEDSLGGEAAPDDTAYARAFDAIAESPDNRLLVAEEAGRIVGTFQLTYIPNLSLIGGPRLQIEAVRVASARRGEGLGEAMMRWAIAYGRERGCVLVQLTTNAQRADARRFYERVGFAPSHVGMKLPLDRSQDL